MMYNNREWFLPNHNKYNDFCLLHQPNHPPTYLLQILYSLSDSDDNIGTLTIQNEGLRILWHNMELDKVFLSASWEQTS
jgi:hypothetical protein